jgi:hypothetical protein
MAAATRHSCAPLAPGDPELARPRLALAHARKPRMLHTASGTPAPMATACERCAVLATGVRSPNLSLGLFGTTSRSLTRPGNGSCATARPNQEVVAASVLR